MNYLIICSFFPPDRAVAAVRPYMLAKYLSKAGHSVVVLRSGAFNSAPDDSLPELENVQVVSYLGADSDAEKYKRGEYAPAASVQAEIRAMIPWKLKKILLKPYAFFRDPIDTRRRVSAAKSKFELQKKALNELSDRHFDIVFSTYSDLENIYAGEYAASLFHAKWIMDFRDPVVAGYSKSFYAWNKIAAKIQKHAVEHSDLCTTISEGISSEFSALYPTANIQTLYNGFEANDSDQADLSLNTGVFTACYTGQVYYDLRREGLELFIRCLKELLQRGVIDKSKVRFIYAGKDSDSVRDLFRKHSVEEILDDRGYVSRSVVQEIQNRSDIFLVTSWNTASSQGVLTGKFYEGIRAKKNILAVVCGDRPNSELKLLNDKYHYGFCYEKVSGNETALIDYLERICTEKINTGKVAYCPSPQLMEAFRYDMLAQKLNMYAEDLVKDR